MSRLGTLATRVTALLAGGHPTLQKGCTGSDVKELQEILDEYANPDTERYAKMVDRIREIQNFTSLGYHRLDDMLEAVGIDPDHLCTYCWNGK